MVTGLVAFLKKVVVQVTEYLLFYPVLVLLEGRFHFVASDAVDLCELVWDDRFHPSSCWKTGQVALDVANPPMVLDNRPDYPYVFAYPNLWRQPATRIRGDMFHRHY